MGVLCAPPPLLPPQNINFPGKLRFWSEAPSPAHPCTHKVSHRHPFLACAPHGDPPPLAALSLHAAATESICTRHTTIRMLATYITHPRTPRLVPVPHCPPGWHFHHIIKYLLTPNGLQGRLPCPTPITGTVVRLIKSVGLMWNCTNPRLIYSPCHLSLCATLCNTRRYCQRIVLALPHITWDKAPVVQINADRCESPLPSEITSHVCPREQRPPAV